MKNWTIAGLTIGAVSLFGFFSYAMHLDAKKSEICHDSVEIRVTTDSEFKCHKDATLSHMPHGLNNSNVLVTCTCKR
jgi:hypothetical protein